MIKLSLIALEQTGAGPVYSLEMARALASAENCELQIIVSDTVSNLEAWKVSFSNAERHVHFKVIKAYKHTKTSVFLQFFNLVRKWRIVKLIKDFNPDALYVPFGLMWSRFIYAFIPSHVKIIRTIHDVQSHDKFNFSEVVSSLLTMGSNRLVDGYVILNEKDKSLIHSKYKKPVVVIPHASFGYYFKKEVTEQKTLQHRIGFLGRIEPYKGLDLLVMAFEMSITEGLQLLIAGSGGIDKDLLIRIENNDRIELINRYIKDDEFQPLLDKCDFVVLPYKRASQSGVIPMCFAYGKTVIATNVGALSEQVPEGTGIITEPDAEHIASQIDSLYASPDTITDYGEAARKYAEKELSWEHSANLLLDFINKL